MKKEYDFSDAEQGKFYRPACELDVPIYLDREVREFFAQRAAARHISLDKLIGVLLKKEMEVFRRLG